MADAISTPWTSPSLPFPLPASRAVHPELGSLQHRTDLYHRPEIHLQHAGMNHFLAGLATGCSKGVLKKTPRSLCLLDDPTTSYLQTERKAERVGFEPTRRLNTAYAISNRAPSANSDTSPEAMQGSLPKGKASAPM